MFTDTIQELANLQNIKIAQMLKDLEMGQGTFSTWKKRGTIPSGEVLQRIADYFGVSVDYLLGKEQKEKPAAQSDGQEDDLYLQARQLIGALSPEGQEQAMRYLRFLAAEYGQESK